MKKRSICILGGSGFVGRHLMSRLARDGHHMKVLTRHRERHKDLLVLPTAEVVEANIHDPEQLQRELAGSDTVINLVGILNEKGHDGKGFQRAHVELPRKIVEACRANRIPRLLHMSALGGDAAYGHSQYQRTKGEGENLVHAAHDLHVTSFRPSVIFGPGDSFLNRFAGLLKISPYLFPLACPEARFAPVYVGDVVEAYARALDNHACFGQRYDLCGPRSYSLRELVEYVARVLGLHRRIIGLGTGLSRLQANVLEWAPGKPFSRDNFLSMQTDAVCSGGFPEVFGIEPTPLESVAPIYLGQKHQRARLDEFRRALPR
jgi:uncharacterized protein YbjT (DUF2867 family)